jgi:hypothetical protein
MEHSENVQVLTIIVYLTTISELCSDKLLAPPAVLAIGLVVLKRVRMKTGTVRIICQMKLRSRFAFETEHCDLNLRLFSLTIFKNCLSYPLHIK